MQEQQTAGTAIKEANSPVPVQAADNTHPTLGINSLYYRMTPEILAEIAFQNAALLASKLWLSHQPEFWKRLHRLEEGMRCQHAASGNRD